MGKSILGEHLGLWIPMQLMVQLLEGWDGLEVHTANCVSGG